MIMSSSGWEGPSVGLRVLGGEIETPLSPYTWLVLPFARRRRWVNYRPSSYIPSMTYDHTFIVHTIHLFIYTKHLYSAFSRELLRSALDSSTAKKSSLKLRKKCRWQGCRENPRLRREPIPMPLGILSFVGLNNKEKIIIFIAITI